MPRTFGDICSRWRHIALAEPRFRCAIDFDEFECENLPRLNGAFRQGGQYRLWLSERKGQDDQYTCDGFLRDVVYSQSKRITELSMFVFEQLFQEFLSFPLDSFPVLAQMPMPFKALHTCDALTSPQHWTYPVFSSYEPVHVLGRVDAYRFPGDLNPGIHSAGTHEVVYQPL